MKYRQPGDAVAATQLTWPALWWYGELPLPGTDPAIPPPREAPAMLELVYVSNAECERSSLETAFDGHRRVLVYVGFPDSPEGFDDLLFRALDDLGAVVAYGRFSEPSRAVVIDLRPDAVDSMSIPQRQKPPGRPEPLDGCVGARPMRRW